MTRDRPQQAAAATASTGVDLLLKKAQSRATPFYREFPPAPDLAPFVACTWARIARFDCDTKVEAILPDGCTDIMVYDDHPPRVAGPDAVTRHAALGNGTLITGIRLRPGAWRAVHGCSADSMVNGSALLTDLAPASRALGPRLLGAASHAARMALLENWVRAALGRVTHRDRAVIAAGKLLSGHAQITVGEVAAHLRWNARTLHRQFLASCGYSPKHLQRIMRMQTLLRGVHAGRAPSLSSLASTAGYADQAHMTRDFRDLTGFTPSEYLASRVAPGWGAWITADW
jgi:AraC-like DNA-binding protein